VRHPTQEEIPASIFANGARAPLFGTVQPGRIELPLLPSGYPMLRRLPLFLLMLPLAASAGPAATDVLVDFLAIPGSAGLGAIQRVDRNPYRGERFSRDLVPLYMYEGRRVYLHGTRVGVKFSDIPEHGLELFLDYRYEGHPNANRPDVLAGMARRGPGIQAGAAYRGRTVFGNFDLELLHDANNTSHGSELRLGYSFDLHSGRWHFRPSWTVARRSANLNNYYYGVRAGEATALRPAWMPGAGTDLTAALYGYYELSRRWRLLGGLGVTYLDGGVRSSPVVEDRPQVGALVGAAYDFGSHDPYGAPGRPLAVRLFGGRATECNFLPAVTLRCGSTRTGDDTRIWGVDVGRELVQRVNGWPLDFYAYAGVLGHDERGLRANGAQLDAQIKAYWYGLPWDQVVRTRIGFGAGFSLAQRVPLTEVRDQARRGRATSRLLNYLDPSIDVNLGDLTGSRALGGTVVGVGVSHRSGIFGSSQLLGNINGGSNYLYGFIETKL
jgi:outer membrane protein